MFITEPLEQTADIFYRKVFSPETESPVSGAKQFHKFFNPVSLQHVVLEPADQPQSKSGVY